MKKNLDFYVVLFICLLICGSLYVLYDHTSKYSVADSNNVVTLRGPKYNVRSHNVFSHSSSTFSGGGVGVVQSPTVVSSRSGASSRVSDVSVPSYVRTNSQVQAPSSYLPMLSTTGSISSNGVSPSAFASRSKGGATSGVSIMSGASHSLVYSEASRPLVYGGGVRYSAPSSASQRSLLELSSSSYVGSGDAVVRQSVSRSSASSPSLSVSSAYSSAYANTSRELSVYGDITSIGETFVAPYRARVPHRAPPGYGDNGSGLGDTWGNWLDKNWNKDSFGGTIVGDDVWFTEDEAKGIYDTMFGEDSDYWNEGMGNPPTEDEFLDWLRNKGGKYHMPIGDTLPLVLIGLAYMLVVFVFKRK